MNLNETTRIYFAKTAEVREGRTRRHPRDPRAAARSAALARLSSARPATTRSTRHHLGVATMLHGGHAINALPQLATAGVNCRILPGEPVEGVQAQIERVLADKEIEVKGGKAKLSPPSPLNEEIMGSIEKLSKEFWPDAAVVPVMSTGATDGLFLRNAGIPTYGHSGLGADVDDNRIMARMNAYSSSRSTRGRIISIAWSRCLPVEMMAEGKANLRVAVAGLGAIGTDVVKALDRGIEGLTLVAVSRGSPDKHRGWGGRVELCAEAGADR